MGRLTSAILPCLAGVLLAAPGDAPAVEDDALLIHDVTVVSPERGEPLRSAWVSVRDGRIRAIGEGEPSPSDRRSHAAVMDGGGRYLTPSLIDSHVHLAYIPGFPVPEPPELEGLAAAYAAQLPRSYLYFGYTTVVDLNVTDRSFIDSFTKAPLHPDVFDCDGALVLANGYPMAFLPPDFRFRPFPNFLYDARQAGAIPDEYSPEDHSASAAVDRVAAHGGICVKTFWETGFGPLRDLPTPTQAMIDDVIEASHAKELVVTMHANSLAAHQFAVEAGVDIIVHGLWNAPADGKLSEATRAVLDSGIAANVGYMPTMQVLRGLALMLQPGFLDDRALEAVLPRELIEWYKSADGQWFVEEFRADFNGADTQAILATFGGDDGPLAAARLTTAYLARHGGRLLFGSDTPSAPTYGNPPGYNGYLEMRNLVDAGVSLRQLLVAATIANAEAFNLDDRYGTIEPGKVANLLLLRENPLESVEAWNSIEVIVLHGDWIERSALSATRRSPALNQQSGSAD